ncbi:MAG TPA: hypothetical protein PLL86_14425, partial [Leptospiraceae bacterium]|nr:hypothetical protein [Leptospiraceae bacterium]
MKRKILLFTLITVCVDFLSCNGTADGKSSVGQLVLLAFRAARLANERVELSGTVKGPGSVKNASVKVFPTPANGQCIKEDGTLNGTPIATTKSDENGKYNLSYKKTGTTVCVVVVPDDGSQIDVFSPASRTNAPKPWSGANNLMAVVNEPSGRANSIGASKTVNVTPFTRMAARRFGALSTIAQNNGG